MSKVSFWDHPIEKLEEALHLKKQIHALQSKLSSLFGSDDDSSANGKTPAAPVANAPKQRGGKRVFSAATRAKMAASQQARYAQLRGSSAAPAAKAAPGKKKRNLSPEGRARIVAALKARHAAKRAGKK
jgi:hypothetical protein